MDRPIIIYHGSCADGFTAAWVAYRRFGPDCEFIPAQYGQEPPDVTDREVYILDFSYKFPVMEKLATQARYLVCLDHHKTAESELAGFETTKGQVAFDMAKSGARLAWEWFHPAKEAPWLVDYTEDRDLRRWALESSREVSAAIASYPMTFEQWDEWGLAPSPFKCGLDEQGEAILRYQQQQVDNLCQHAHEVELDGHRDLSVNTSLLISEVAGKLAEGRPFGATWFEKGDGSRVWSLRSRDGGADVSEIAKARGGGGHRNAAGFTAKD